MRRCLSARLLNINTFYPSSCSPFQHLFNTFDPRQSALSPPEMLLSLLPLAANCSSLFKHFLPRASQHVQPAVPSLPEIFLKFLHLLSLSFERLSSSFDLHESTCPVCRPLAARNDPTPSAPLAAHFGYFAHAFWPHSFCSYCCSLLKLFPQSFTSRRSACPVYRPLVARKDSMVSAPPSAYFSSLFKHLLPRVSQHV